MKAWRVDLTSSDFAYVLAEPGAKALGVAMRHHDWLTWEDIEWKEVSKHRVPELDGDRITHRQLCERGTMWIECAGCYTRIGETATPKKFHDNYDFSVYPPVRKPDDQIDPRYLDTEDGKPYWEDEWTGWCCQACYDDHPQYHGTGRPLGSAICIALSTEY